MWLANSIKPFFLSKQNMLCQHIFGVHVELIEIPKSRTWCCRTSSGVVLTIQTSSAFTINLTLVYILLDELHMQALQNTSYHTKVAILDSYPTTLTLQRESNFCNELELCFLNACTLFQMCIGCGFFVTTIVSMLLCMGRLNFDWKEITQL